MSGIDDEYFDNELPGEEPEIEEDETNVVPIEGAAPPEAEAEPAEIVLDDAAKSFLEGQTREQLKAALEDQPGMYERLEVGGFLPEEGEPAAAELVVANTVIDEESPPRQQTSGDVQALIQQNASLQQQINAFMQQPQQQSPGQPEQQPNSLDPMDQNFNPDGLRQQIMDDADSRMQQQRMDDSYERAASEHGGEMVNAAMQYAEQSGLAGSFSGQHSPVEAAVKHYQGQQVLQRVGNTPEALSTFISEIIEHVKGTMQDETTKAGLEQVVEQMNSAPAGLTNKEIPPSLMSLVSDADQPSNNIDDIATKLMGGR